MVRLQERIAVLMECGATLDRVEREVIEPCGLSSGRKSALWLYACAMADPGSEQFALDARVGGPHG
jgi:hypothetical protein